MSDQKHILILCSHSYEKQPRVLRTIEALRPFYHLTVAGSSGASSHEVSFIDLSTHLRLDQRHAYWHFDKPAPIRLPMSFYHKYIRQKQFYKPFYYEYQYWTASRRADLALLKKHHFDLIISHGIDTLPLAVKLSGKEAPVIFNAHEYYPLEFEQDKQWLATEGARASYLVKTYLPKCAYLFCVSGLILRRFIENTPIPASVITNAANFVDQSPKPVDPGKIQIIHHGIALRERDIAHMATLIDHLDERFELNIMLTVAEPAYYEELKRHFSAHPRIRLLPAAPLDGLPQFLNQFDIGYYILPPVNFNTTYALPNKLFEYVQARLCLAFGPSPEMKAVIEQYGLGVVSEEFTPVSVANRIRSLSVADIQEAKARVHRSALALSAEANQKQILDTVNSLLEKRCVA